MQQIEFFNKLLGDSGAVVIDEDNYAVGLLFSVSEGVDVCYANPIKPVLDYFGVTLAG